jgi:hypothetical protein
MTEPNSPPRSEVTKAVAERRAREAARLRENLRRRKEQARARSTEPGPDAKREDRGAGDC